MLRKNRLVVLIATIFVLLTSAYSQNRFEGYSLVVEADNGGACPVRYLPGAGDGNAIDVFVAGTNQRTAAATLTACDGSRVDGNKVFTNSDGRWCFAGGEQIYDVKLRNGVTYLWPAIDKNSGTYNVKDFRPVTRSVPGPTQYVFSEPADYTKTIKNAIAFIAARQGGILRFPDGDYIVGTLDGSRRDPLYQGIALPSGIIVEGASWNQSIPTTNLPPRTSATRIRLRHENQTIFRIGGCTNNVTVRQMELLGNSALYAEAPRGSIGTYGIEGIGKWAINPATGEQAPNTTQGIKVENVTFQNFDKGFYVHNANDANCNSREQYCGAWQFDYVVLDHGIFINNKTGLWIDTFDTDWVIRNSFFAYAASNAPGDGIRIAKAGNMLIEQTFGGGYNYEAQVGGTFLHIDTATSVTVIASASERGRRSIYTNPGGSITSMMLNVIGSTFGDKIDLNGRLNYVSSGNFYLARTLDAEPSVTITSVNDRYCYDSQVLPGKCVDEAGRKVENPGVTGGRRMFETGRVGEETPGNRIEGKPNFFGYNVRIGDGLLQFDPGISFKDITTWTTASGTRPRVEDGAFVYCKDCRKDDRGICTQGTVGRDGAFAKRINGQWRCD